MDDVAVINASPIIFFGRSEHWDLLTASARRLIVPQAVATEILARGDTDPAVRRLRGDPRMVIAQPIPIPVAIEAWGLGAGESAVIALALATTGAVAVIDDLAGRKCAAALGVRVRGTLGLVLVAKQHGAIPSARTVVDDLLNAGMYLSRRVIDSALARVGE